MSKLEKWRERLGLNMARLAQLSGYSPVTLYWYFRGITPPRTKRHVAGRQESKHIPEPEWTRFRNICAGVEYQLKNGKRFDW